MPTWRQLKFWRLKHTEVCFFQSPTAKPWLPWSPAWPHDPSHHQSSSQLWHSWTITPSIPDRGLLLNGTCDHWRRGFKVSNHFNQKLQSFIVLQVYIDLIKPPKLAQFKTSRLCFVTCHLAFVSFSLNNLIQCPLPFYFQIPRDSSHSYPTQLDACARSKLPKLGALGPFILRCSHSELLLCRVFEFWISPGWQYIIFQHWTLTGLLDFSKFQFPSFLALLQHLSFHLKLMGSTASLFTVEVPTLSRNLYSPRASSLHFQNTLYLLLKVGHTSPIPQWFQHCNFTRELLTFWNLWFKHFPHISHTLTMLLGT